MARLLDSLRAAGAQDQVTALLRRDPAAHAALDDPAAVASLLDRLREAGAQDQVTALAAPRRRPRRPRRPGRRGRAAGQPAGGGRAGPGHRPAGAVIPPPTSPSTTRSPWPRCWTACGRRARQDQVTALADRAAAHVALDDPGAVARLLDSLRAAGAQDQVTALARDPAAHVALDDPGAVAGLLDSLREAGAQDQVTALLRRDPAAHAALDDPDAVAELLDSLREAGAQDQVTALVDRLPAAGMFELFREQEDRQDQFRFGREADGSPAEPWGWEDLD